MHRHQRRTQEQKQFDLHSYGWREVETAQLGDTLPLLSRIAASLDTRDSRQGLLATMKAWHAAGLVPGRIGGDGPRFSETGP